MREDVAAGAAVLTGGLTFVVTAAVGVLWLDNADGPWPDHPGLGLLLGLVAALLAGSVVLLATWWLARRSRWLLLATVVLVGAGSVVLLPRSIDVSESFLPQPGPRWSCTGWSFSHYPPQTMDASSTTYCVGLEHRIADG